MEVGTYHSHGVLSPNYDKDANMATLSRGEGFGLVLQVGQNKKLLSTCVPRMFLPKIIKVQL